MRALHDRKAPQSSSLSPEILEKRLKREKQARAEAERLLEEKSRELYTSNTTLKTVAEAVENQRVQLDTILEYTPAGIVLANNDLTITRANRKALMMFGLGEDYFATTVISDLFEDFSTVGLANQEGSEKQALQEVNLQEAMGCRTDGVMLPIEYGFTKIDLDGKQQSVWIFKDITKRKHAEAKRSALENELRQAQKMEALGTLASGVAHEINTPIQYISDNLRFLEDTIADLIGVIKDYETATASLKLDENTHKLFSKIHDKIEEIDLEFLCQEGPLSVEQSLEGVGQVASIVNAIKEFSHPGEDEKSELDLNHAIETTLTVARNQWKYVADIQTQFDPNLPRLDCLPGAINQVILNMVVNAADAISALEKNTKGNILISTKVVDDHIELVIQDDGCGIPNDIKEKIFDPFFTTKGVGKGTGQGLAICYSIIKQKHKGMIECSSQVGVGTTFKILLPVTLHPAKEQEVA